MNVRDSKMEKAPMFKLLMSMSIPVMLSMFIQALYNIIDSVYVSRIGTNALTAVSLAFPLQNIILAFAVGTGVGVSSAISIYRGSGNREGADRAASIGIMLTFIHNIIIIVGGLIFIKPFLKMFTDDPLILHDACVYTYIVCLVSCGCLLQIIIEKIFQGIGEMKLTMYFMAAGCIINVILDPILIFGYLGFPAMGIAGAAIATVIGQISATVISFVVYFKGDYDIKLKWKYMKPDRRLLKQIYNVAVPSGVMILMPSILISSLNAILGKINTIYIAVLGIYYKLQMFTYMPGNGLIQGMRPIIGYNYGAGNDERVKEAIKNSIKVLFCIMLTGTVLAIAIPDKILMMFDAEPALMESGVTALRIIGLGLVVSTIGTIYAGVFEALGMGKYSLIVSLLRQLVITVPLGFVLSRFLGAVGVWIAFPAGEIVAAVVAVILLKKHENGRFDVWKREKEA